MKYLIAIRHGRKTWYFKDEVVSGPRFVSQKKKAREFPHGLAAQQRINDLRLYHATKPYTFSIVSNQPHPTRGLFKQRKKPRTLARLRPHKSEVKAARARLLKKHAGNAAMLKRLRARFKRADRG
jgi:hypothetical protein